MKTTLRSLALRLLKLFIKLSFPNVSQITTVEFAAWLLDSAKLQPFVLDARSQAEHAVSHIKTAMRIDPVAPDLTALSTVSQDTPIVVYCSVGYRSAKVAQQLQRKGFSQIFNLSGGLFQWANETRPMFKDDEHPTQLVHPYDATWGKLLKTCYHAEN
ncbi:rhodanese-like domain-containing protein [Dendronalium sp. ChiSLP03b]|uniref:rhodanese-like domain-containing protein n=1 Tax=Dendronalium sp. ChiSLP03b TaxID=3075381 RepID=UPI002AD37F7E|nr:rhodanese-like domain-containing protein [Dendronalium sp. ChiSLP03b]MDZ8204340.1 rhodanese-like domain-containing protein [Dendronalium sp. ChiSLP03b]